MDQLPMTDFIRFIYCAIKAYRRARKTGKCFYYGISVGGVPQMCVFVGIGRESWRVTEIAVASCNWKY